MAATGFYQAMTEFCEQVDPHVLLEMRRARPFRICCGYRRAGSPRWKDELFSGSRPAPRKHRPRPSNRPWHGRANRRRSLLRPDSPEPLCSPGRDRLSRAQLVRRFSGRHPRPGAPASPSTLRLLRRPHGGQFRRARAHGWPCPLRLHASVDRHRAPDRLSDALNSVLSRHPRTGRVPHLLLAFGPTELRLLLAIGNLALLWKPVVHLFGGQYLLLDVGGAIGLAGMGLMAVVFTLQNTARLYREERLPQ